MLRTSRKTISSFITCSSLWSTSLHLFVVVFIHSYYIQFIFKSSGPQLHSIPCTMLSTRDMKMNSAQFSPQILSLLRRQELNINFQIQWQMLPWCSAYLNRSRLLKTEILQCTQIELKPLKAKLFLGFYTLRSRSWF